MESNTFNCEFKEQNDEGESSNKEDRSSKYLLDICNIFQPFWIRRSIQIGYGLDRFILDYGRYFLLPVGFLFWFILLLTEKI
jgi:hypothetical protein